LTGGVAMEWQCMRRLFPLTISAVLLSGGADGALRADQPPTVADEAKFYRLIFSCTFRDFLS
jgi:hypothetical protein